MARTVYCRHDGCTHTVQIDAGNFPAYCAKCGRAGRWSVRPWNEPETVEKPYELSEKDRYFLMAIKVSPDA